MAFTLTDKALLDRAARMINGEAKALRLEFEAVGWAVTEAGRKAKQEYDRLLRDERDLRALGKRLSAHFDVKAAPRVAKPAQDVDDPEGGLGVDPVVTEPSLGEQRALGVHPSGGDLELV
jgi:hypothetical protein